MFEALDNKGGERATMLPAMRQTAEAARGARVDEMFEWPDGRASRDEGFLDHEGLQRTFGRRFELLLPSF